MKLGGRTVLITGAASGIGRAMARRVAERGGRVVGWDIDAARLESMIAELPGSGHRWDVVDVTDRQLVYDTARRTGAIDVLINNAGIVSGQRLLEASDEQIEKTMGVNALALFWTTRAFLPGMALRGSGHVVTVASAGGLVGVSGLVDYSASKFAAVGFDDALRSELGRTAPGVKTTLVCPYYINTGMFDGVRTRFPLLLPILEEAKVAGRIVRAIEKGRPRVVTPLIVRLVPLLRMFPVSVFDAVVSLLGLNRGMDHFRGRRGATGK
jgi:all-trans-retinol dehydrogenase (NAD+)